MGLLDRFFGRNPEHVVRDLLQQSNGLKVGDLPRFQQRFAARLRELGEPAVDPLIAQFDDASGNPRFLIAQSLAAMSAGDFGTDTGVRIRDWLITALKDKDPTVRDVVAMHICRCRDVAVLEPLIRCALGDPSKGTRDIARDSALKFIAELHRLPAEARHDFEPLFQQLRAACADFPEDDITHALDALARTTTSAETPVSVEAGETASVPGPQGPSNVDSLLSAIMEHAPILIGDTSQEERLAKLSSLGPSIVPNIDSAIERFIDTQGEHSTSHYQNAGMLCEMMGKLGGEEALGRLSRYANATSNIWEYKYIREGAKRGLASLSQTSAAVAGHDSKPSNKSVHLQKPQGQDARESMLREEAVVSETIDLAPGITVVFVKVPAGEFLMGSDPHVDPSYCANETPQQTVHLDEFWIGKYPVTNEQYWAFDPDRRERGNWDEGRRDMERLPKRYMSLSDAKRFCEWASAQSGRVIRIPTEAEWEKAARGTDGRIWPWGNSPPNSALCNFSGTGLRETSPVGAFSPQGDSPYGCADMAGNVFELTDGKYIRGGYHSFAENMVRCALRWQDVDSATGFRVVTEGLSAHVQKPHGRDARESMLAEEADASDSETPWRTHPTPEAEVAGALSRVVFEGGYESYLDVYADRSRGWWVQFLVVCARSEILGCLPGNGLLSEEDALGHGAIGDLVQRGWSLDSDGYFFEKRWDLGDEEVTVEGVVREGLEALGGAYGVEAAAPLDMELNLGTDGGSTAQVGQDDRVQVLIQELPRVIGSGLDMSAVARVRELGEELNRIGGMSLMIDASMKASEINPRVRGFLGKWWDGVGDWVD